MNLLDNWYFGPGVINQRGQLEYENTGYTVDRWKLSNQGNKVELTDGGIKGYSTQEGTGANLVQIIENAGWLSGKTVTLSMLRTEGDSTQFFGLLRAYLQDGSNVYVSTTTREEYDLFNVRTFKLPENITKVDIWLRFCDSRNEAVGAYSTILAAKLELGDHQTLAEEVDGTWQLLDPPPNPATELLKCMRYQQAFQAGAAYGFTTTATQARAFLPLAVPMRANPTLVSSNMGFSGLRAAGSGGDQTVTNTTTTARALQDNQAASNRPHVSINFTFNAEHGIPLATPVVGYLTGALNILDANL